MHDISVCQLPVFSTRIDILYSSLCSHNFMARSKNRDRVVIWRSLVQILPLQFEDFDKKLQITEAQSAGTSWLAVVVV